VSGPINLGYIAYVLMFSSTEILSINCFFFLSKSVEYCFSIIIYNPSSYTSPNNI